MDFSKHVTDFFIDQLKPNTAHQMQIMEGATAESMRKDE